MTASALIRLAGLVATTAIILAVTACDLRRDGDRAEEHVLRVHDVSHLQIEELDAPLRELLKGEDFPLRGTIERIDQRWLAVNGSELLQEEIARLLTDLGETRNGGNATVDRDFRLQLWLLTLLPDRDDDELPRTIESLAEVVRHQFPKYGIQVSDFVETFGSNSMASLNVTSGGGTQVFLRPLRLTSDGAHITGRVQARPPRDAQAQFSTFDISRNLRAGKPLVLGRKHGGTLDEQAFYQVVVARMDWND